METGNQESIVPAAKFIEIYMSSTIPDTKDNVRSLSLYVTYPLDFISFYITSTVF